MDIPAFHLDFMGNRLLIAIIAILHVLINHSLAVGLIPLVVLLERLGYKLQNPDWDELARKIMFFAFLFLKSRLFSCGCRHMAVCLTCKSLFDWKFDPGFLLGLVY